MKLKHVRIILSVLILGFWVLVFLGENSQVTKLAHPLGQFQFYPALQFVLSLGKIGPGLITILLITLLWGRVYCSSLCPLGTLQDSVVALSRKVRRGRFKKQKPLKSLRYTLLALTIITVLLGSLSLIHLLEPYSLFGKLLVGVIGPFLAQLSILGEKIGIMRLNPGTFHSYSLEYFLLFLSILTLLAILTWRRGRVFCNSLCPVGVFLGICSKVAFYKIDMDKEKCIQCGKCEALCKSGCIQVNEKEIDNERCVRCFNCLDICPVDAIHIKLSPLKKMKKKAAKENVNGMQESRRQFLVSLGQIGILGAASFLPLSIFSQKQGQLKKEWRKLPITPPGSGSLEHFSKNCISCHLCVSRCPTKVLKPHWSFPWQRGLFQPQLDYTKGYCEYDCHVCSQVCPTQAIREITLEQKHKIQLGQVQLIRENCIVYAKGLFCGACAEHCPTTAVYMEPYQASLYGPVTNTHICVGCGHCELVCPALPWKAIYVKPHEVHQVALLPEKGTIKKETGKKDFPF